MPKFLLKALAKVLPPASWYFTRNPVSSAIWSSSAFKLWISMLPLVLGTNKTVAFPAEDLGLALLPALWKIFFLLYILPLDLDIGKVFQGSSSLVPLYQVPLFRAFSLDFRSFLQPAFGNSDVYPGWSGSRRFLFTLASKDRIPCSTAFLMNSSQWPSSLCRPSQEFPASWQGPASSSCSLVS